MSAGEKHTRSAAETEALGRALAAALEPGDVVTLTGPLGAGKTRLVAGIAEGLGVKAHVRSPTFTLVNEYRGGRPPLFHVDLYRLESGETVGLGIEEMLESGALVVEWGERLPAALRREALAITIEPGVGDERRLTASAERDRGLALLEAWSRVADASPSPNL
jgi:tRNA threonylcarbamoyladenosine biosynthesis protein TsaE